jgi:Carboxypeptidase regulatory-like domain
VLTAVLVVWGLAAGPQVRPPSPPPPTFQGPARDPARRPPPETRGTGIIRGRVVAADTGLPIRRATVVISMTMPPRTSATAAGSAAAPQGTPVTATRVTSILNGAQVSTTFSSQGGINFRQKTATTDAQGAFEFRDLPPGTYRLTGNPGQYSATYLSTVFGARKPNGPGSIDLGTPVELAHGETFDKAMIGLLRGAVISGRVSDENGEPLARVQVYPILFAPGSPRGTRTGSNAQTDDLGQFRLFGLMPGDYVVAAEARSNSYVPPEAPPETEEERVGFMTTFYPGTADDASAQRVRTRSGAETPGIEIRMVSGRLFHVTGMVTDSHGGTGRANGSLLRRTTGSPAVNSTFGFSTDERGRFQMRNVPPGNYRLTVRQQPPPGARTPDGSTEQGEFSTLALSVVGDVDDILIVTSPGATITGTLVLEGTPESSSSSLQMRVSAASGDPEAMMGVPMPQAAAVRPDLTFTMKGFMGEFLLRASASGYYLKSVTLGAQDITDTPREFKNGDKVTLTLTSRAGEIQGTVTDETGKPTSDAGLLLFSDDKASWRMNSIRTRRSGPDSVGRYRMPGLLAGRYILVAVPRERLNALSASTDPSFFEALAKEGTTVVVGEDEQRQVDVRVTAGGGGH